jgi:hypothetical protein
VHRLLMLLLGLLRVMCCGLMLLLGFLRVM